MRPFPLPVMALAFVASALAAPASSDALRNVPCPAHRFAGEVVCHALDVPENPERPEGRVIALRIMVLRATGPTRVPDPLFPIAGGPGQAASEGTFFATFFAPVRASRDIVLLDQRGTGSSNALALAPSDEDLFIRPELNIPPEWGRAALAGLSAKADLTQYTTARAVDDLDAMRRALGARQINLYGTSYGTRVVQYYIKRHGEHVRSAVLKGVVSPDANIALSYGRNPQRALERLFALCAADSICAAAHPSLRADLDAVLARLDRAPVTVEVAHPRTGKSAPFTVTRGNFAFGVRSQMMNAAAFARLPALIAEAAAGDFKAWATFLAQTRKSYAQDLYGGMTFSVAAAEDVPRLSEALIRADAQDTLIGDKLARGFAELAAFWPRGDAPPDLFTPLRSDVPILLVSGDLDPATPPAGADPMLPGLPNARHLVFAGGAHSGANFTGLDKIIEEFIREGSVAGLDVSAAETSRPLPFQPPQ